MPKLDYRNIESDMARCGGQPITVVGTRIRVATILGCYRQGMGVEEIVQQYPASNRPTFMTLWPSPMTTSTRLKAPWQPTTKRRLRPDTLRIALNDEYTAILHG